MAEIGNKWPTLLDVAGRTGMDGSLADVAEILNASNEVLDDAPFLEGNDGTGHKTTVRSGLPDGTWRQLNYGVQPTKSTTVSVRDTAGMLEDYAEVDKDLADMNGNAAAFRLSEDKAHIEGLSKNMKRTLIYGNTATEPEKFMGLAPRFNSIAGAVNGSNIIDAGGTGSSNTSIWVVNWGPDKVHMFYPKGSQAGLKREDKGQETLFDANGGRFEGYRTHYQWKAGLSVRDWRYIVRVANLDSTLLKADMSTGPKLVDLMTQALETIQDLNGKPVIYANRTIVSMLRRQIRNIPNLRLDIDEVSGKHVVMFDGVPVRRVDEILNTEARVV